MAETDRQFADKAGTGQVALLWEVTDHLVREGPAQNRAPYAWALASTGATITPRRNTESQVLVVVESAGTNRVGDKEFNSAPKTVIVVPPWSQIEIAARAQTILFGFTDRAPQQALGLCRSEGDTV